MIVVKEATKRSNLPGLQAYGAALGEFGCSENGGNLGAVEMGKMGEVFSKEVLKLCVGRADTSRL